MAASDPFLALDENIMREIFAFVGPGCYRYVAANKRFQALYLKVYHGRKEVYAMNAVESVACAKLASEEVPFWRLGDSVNNYLCKISGYDTHHLSHSPGFHRAQDPKGTISPIAARYGKIEVVKWCYSVGLPWHAPVYVHPYYNDFPEMWRYHMWNDQTCQAAARGGHLNIIIWARNHGCPWNAKTCAAAALGGHLKVLTWVHENGCPWNEDTCSAAAFAGHLEVLKYARQEKCPWDSRTCKMASRSGYLNILQWAHGQGCPWDKDDTCYDAARYGNLQMLQYALAHGCELEMDKIYEIAAKHGHAHFFQWRVDQGDNIWDALHWRIWDICVLAAERGHLTVIQWAVENGYSWNPLVCERAAAKGHLDILIYAYSQGLPWEPQACTRAAYERQFDALQWLTAHGCPWEKWIFSAATAGAIHTKHSARFDPRNFQVLQWVLNNGTREQLDRQIDACIDRCVSADDTEVLSVLLEHYFGGDLQGQTEAKERAADRYARQFESHLDDNDSASHLLSDAESLGSY